MNPLAPISILGFSDPVSSWSHLLAAVSFLVGGVILIVRGWGNTPRVVSLVVYSLALVFLFSMSGVFHLLERGTEARDVLQRLDHAAIWTLIAATFTPIHIILFRGRHRWMVLLAVWVFALTGLIFEVVFFTSFPESVLLGLFLGLGWVGFLSGATFRKVYADRSLRLLATGGILYTVGAIIDFVYWPTLIVQVLGPHEIFHLFILAAATAHWLFIYKWCNHPISNTLVFWVSLCPNEVVARAVGEDIVVTAKDVDDLKKQIQAISNERYHDSIEPVVRLIYFQEECLGQLD